MKYEDLFLKAWELHYKYTKGAITFKKYGLAICDFIGFKDIETINMYTGAELIDVFLQIGNTPATINRKLNTLRGCFLFAYNQKPRMIDIKPQFPYLKETKPIPLFFTKNEQNKLLLYYINRARHTKNPISAKNNLRMYYGIKIDFKTGFRIGNILELNSNNLYMDKYLILPDTKNDESFLIPIPKKSVNDFKKLERLGFFYGWQYHHFYMRFITALKNTGIDVRKSPHKIRHTFATRAAMQGADEKTLLELGNWKSRKCAERYNHFRNLEKKLRIIEEI